MRTLLPFLLSLSLVSACSQPLARSAAPPRKAVFIILDGIPADVIERVPTPAIDAIAAAGGYARAHVGGELGGYCWHRRQPASFRDPCGIVLSS